MIIWPKCFTWKLDMNQTQQCWIHLFLTWFCPMIVVTYGAGDYVPSVFSCRVLSLVSLMAIRLALKCCQPTDKEPQRKFLWARRLCRQHHSAGARLPSPWTSAPRPHPALILQLLRILCSGVTIATMLWCHTNAKKNPKQIRCVGGPECSVLEWKLFSEF